MRIKSLKQRNATSDSLDTFSDREVNVHQPEFFALASVRFKSSGDNEIKETADQRALAQIMGQRYAYYKDLYAQPGGVEDQYFNAIDQRNTQNYSDRAANIASTSSVDLFNDVFGDAKQAMTSQGIGPSSGTFQTALGSIGDNQAKVTSSNVARARQGMGDSYIQGLTNITAMGNGKATDAISGFADIAAQSGERAANNAVNDHNSRSANIYTGAQLAGAGYAAYDEPERRAI